jgi:hypothetical protein
MTRSGKQVTFIDHVNWEKGMMERIFRDDMVIEDVLDKKADLRTHSS